MIHQNQIIRASMCKVIATKFLDGLHSKLRDQISRTDINELLLESNCSRPEDMMVAEIVFPILREHAISSSLISEEQSSVALSIEAYGNYQKRHPTMIHPPVNSGARTDPYPFSKHIDDTSKDLYTRWVNKKSKHRLEQQWPDCSLRVPDGLSILFEVKLVREIDEKTVNGSVELTSGLNEARHYLGLPNAYDKKGQLAWPRYDFAVFLLCDGSEGSKVVSAYSKVPGDIRSSLWNSAAIYPMIIPAGSAVTVKRKKRT